MKLRILHHDHCFDGFASAAVFSRFFTERIKPDAEISYTGLAHKPNQKVIEEELFDGDENAIVDFKYSPSPKITWWFDHHESAFLTPADAEHFESQTSSRMFYDPDFKSCTKFIATIAETRFGFDVSKVSELVEWADTIDGALYKDAQTAVEMKEPAMKLTMVIESAQDDGYVPK